MTTPIFCKLTFIVPLIMYILKWRKYFKQILEWRMDDITRFENIFVDFEWRFAIQNIFLTWDGQVGVHAPSYSTNYFTARLWYVAGKYPFASVTNISWQKNHDRVRYHMVSRDFVMYGSVHDWRQPVRGPPTANVDMPNKGGSISLSKWRTKMYLTKPLTWPSTECTVIRDYSN